jgi:inhibitor of KinA sporulation pathway (predicted exonuclease)
MYNRIWTIFLLYNERNSVDGGMLVHYIIYDLEMTNHLSEVIEIGAVKLKQIDGTLTVVDEFQQFIKPKQDTVDKKITSLTGITVNDVKHAPSFIEATETFKSWIGTENYFLCSWGPEDKWAFINDAVFHDHSIKWLVNHNDIQLYFSMLFENERGFRYGLKRALTLLEIDQSGKQHRALDDAKNTAKIFIKIFDKITLKKNDQSYTESKLLEPVKVVYKTEESEEEDRMSSPFALLADLQK